MTCGLNSLKKFLRNTSGNFAMISAIIAPVLLAAGGISLDVANTLSLKERIQTAADGTNLTVAKRLSSGELSMVDAEDFALKERIQTAADGTNLTVAKRLSSGELSMVDAEDFAKSYLNSQLEAFNDRYVELTYDITSDIEEIVDENITTWNLALTIDANLQSNSLMSFVTDELLTVSVNSGSTTSNEELQGAFSMSIVIDVSGSMAWPTDEAVDMQDILDESRGNAGRVSASIYEAYEIYGLSEDQIQHILQNYSVKDCWKMEDSYDLRVAFLEDIGEPTSTDADLAYNYCYHPAYAAKKADADTIIANWNLVFDNIDASKIRLLKDAASNMLDQMAAADPEEQYVRTGSVTYHSEMDDQTDLEWGISDTMSFINDLKANGGTSSTDAMDWSYDKLKVSDGTEINEHAQKNGQFPDRFILFMTDGENNYEADDTSTKVICDNAKSDGIIIFTVAFAAPEGGQELLEYCATSSEHYFEPETASQLVEAFEYIGRKTTNTPTRLTM